MTPYLNSVTPICLFTIQLSRDYETIKGSLQMSISIKAFWRKIFYLVKKWPKFAFWGKMASKCKISFFFGTTKRHIVAVG